MKNLILIAITALFAQSLFAAPSTYVIKPPMGKVEFKTKGWPNLITIKGEGTGVAGQVRAEAGKANGTLTFDLTTLKTGIDLRDDHMKNKYLQVKEHPVAQLTLTDVKIPDSLEGSFDFSGMMKLHGVEKEITGKGELSKDGNDLKMTAEIPVKLSDFKIEIPSYKGITVAEKVKVNFETKVTPL